MNETGPISTTSAASHARAYRWGVLAAATLAQASTCFLVQGFGPLAPFMQDALRLTAFEIGLLISAAQIVPVIGLLVAGELLDRFSERLIVGGGALVVAVALAAASTASTFPGLLAWLLLVGTGYSSAQPGGSKAVSGWFSAGQRGVAMGVRQSGLPLGGALAAATLPAVAAAHGWPAAFRVGAAVAALGGALFIAVYRAPAEIATHRAASAASALAARLSLLGDGGMRRIMLSGLVLVTTQYGILVFFVLDARDRFGLPVATGALLLVLAQLAGVVGRVALAAWSDRSRNGRTFPIAVCLWALVAGLLAFLVAPGAGPWPLAVLAAWLGFFGLGWYGPWVAWVSESAPPERVGFAFGLVMAINQVAIVASPPLLGFLRDSTGGYAVDWILLIVLLLTCLGATRLGGAPRSPEPELRKNQNS